MCNDSTNMVIGADLILPLFGVLSAALIAAIFSLIQLRTNHITTARIKWLEELRNHVSFFLHDLFSIEQSRKLDFIEEKLGNGYENWVRAKLYFDPKEPHHAKLIEALDDLMSKIEGARAENASGKIMELKREKERIAKVSGYFFNIEWQKIQVRWYWFDCKKKNRIKILKRELALL
jgi:arabinogalactan endo-1,4-beta-galactosidase